MAIGAILLRSGGHVHAPPFLAPGRAVQTGHAHPLAALSLLGALAGLCPAPGLSQEPAAPAPDWQPFFPAGGNRPMSWDRASVAHRGDLVRLTVRAEANFLLGASSYGDFLYEFRCADSRWRVVRTTNYTPAGELLVEEAPNARFARIRPGTWMETIRTAVC